MTQPDSQLVQVIARLLGRSRADGSVQRHVCGHGLHLRVSTDRGDTIALTRPDGQASMDEARTVAEHAGWTFFKAHYVDTGPEHARIRHLVVQPDAPPLEHEPHTPPTQDAHPATGIANERARDAAIRTLLLSPGPWHQEAISLHGSPESREQVVVNFRSCQLEDWLTWVRGKFPAQFDAHLSRHPNSPLHRAS